MKLKYSFAFIFALIAALMTSCTDRESVTGTEMDATRTFTFNVSAGGGTQTRATAPAVTGYKLEYVLQVLDAAGSAVDLGSGATRVTNETGRFEVDLPVGVTYTCLFWAHFIPDGGGENAYFDTADLTAVALKQNLSAEEQCQAFSATADIAADQASATNTVVLTRAVAQVNLKSNTSLEYFDKMEATYTDVPNTFNVKDNLVSTNPSGTAAPGKFTITANPAVGSDGKFTYHTVYFLARGDGNANLLKIKLETFNTGDATPIQTLNINDVPTKKNYKTNVITTLDAASFTTNYTFDFAEWETEELTLGPISVWNGKIPAANANYKFGDPTKNGDSEADAYVISSAADLAQLTANVNAKTGYDGKYFKQDIDIDLNGANYNWTPMGEYPNIFFKANYDGGGHKIINLKVMDSRSTSYCIGGIFTCTGGDIIIKNIHVSGDVSGSYKVGGICGGMGVGVRTALKISGCSFRGNVKGDIAAGGICIGENTIITACANYGTVVGSRGGGIAANTTDNVIIAGCYNAGAINATSTNQSGGIIATGGTIVGCYNTGVIGGRQTNSIANSATVTDCFTAVEYGGTTSGVTVFGSSAWPAYTDSNSPWYVDPNPDGSYTNNGATFSNCKFWKSGGGWNGGSPVYPKLWWEE